MGIFSSLSSRFRAFFKEERRSTRVSHTDTERRGTLRCHDGQTTFFYTLFGRCLQATVVDISMGGVKLAMDNELPPETEGEILFLFNGTPLLLPLKVSWSRKSSKSYEYGARFTAPTCRNVCLMKRYIYSLLAQNTVSPRFSLLCS
ncbi:MAG: PilZ domain-containing protein [Candidatus Eremiobacteraeota bacterium]|nr:PilZ domain-containing protein [Candidatus Eremiobacteraeota bacterium]